MQWIGKKEAQLRMNLWGRQRRPFLFVISYQMDRCLVIPCDEVDASRIRYQIGAYRNFETKDTVFPSSYQWEVEPPSLHDYEKAFTRVQREIYEGNSFLVNLTFSSYVHTNLSLLNIFEYAEAPYKLWIKDVLTVFSPETFMTIEAEEMSCRPMKGTIRAEIPQARQRLLNDAKERSELAIVTDLLRNDMSIVADGVHMKSLVLLEEVETHQGKLLQMSSHIGAHLPDKAFENIGDIIFPMLPAGSICGAPKRKTLSVIDEVESHHRGFYTGIMGVCMEDRVQSAVMIRYMEATSHPDTYSYKSGGGITAGSEMLKEYEELKQKIYVPFYRDYKGGAR